jgi:four helix bundle protein
MSRETENGKRETGENAEIIGRPFHERLDLYRLGRDFAVDLYRTTASFAPEEKFGLVSQIRRAAISIPANVAEGAARRSKKEFSRFLLAARGSATELSLLLDIACRTGNISTDRLRECQQVLDRIFAMSSGLIRRADRLASRAGRHP